MLLEAARGGHVAMINRLVESRLKPNSYSEEKLPLLEATFHDQLEAVEALMAHGADLYLCDKDENRNSDLALRISAAQGHTKLVTFFHTHGAALETGASLNWDSDNKRTALHIAALRGHDMVVRMLIEAGATVDLKDADGRTAFLLAIDSSTLVLELYPGKSYEILSFDLHEVDLNVNFSLEALSYEWKENYGSDPVQCGYEKILITPNCKAAIERRRLESKSRYLWIDAILITQENHQERTKQVARMVGIVTAAKKVLLWLGKETESTRDAFEVIPKFLRAHRMMLQADGELLFDKAPTHQDDVPLELMEGLLEDEMTLQSLKDLDNHPYWNRV
ncbi:heterokaryon incompatibility protein [Fusarium langsethiae]|uniref:Heterokaryon incompatibility protein n=1 Tax=Fusarium langsethiae TaxID=179993 RepID=A0A0N0DAW6_FUSLA|nr:heterokaryon incompatibility protein [Fusarium langsethiae]GKU09419.1 unnamed protein product [Fusarium langsethiae]GKU11474.1 unnamed protein product [Fusarium langsethiae]